MASQEREKGSEVDLECTLCRDTFRAPKTLGCLHSFCLECLEIYVERNHSNVCLSCPICRTPFQAQSLSNLPTDSYILNALNVHNSLSNSQQSKKQKLSCAVEGNEVTCYCLECKEYLCEICKKAHQKRKVSKDHQLIPIDEIKDEDQIKANPQIYCQVHQQKELDLLCNDCKEPICSICVPKHPSHKILTLSEVIGNESQSLIDLINKVQPKEKELREGINKCEEMIQQLEINSTTTQIQINELFNKIRAKLDEKEQELLNKLDEIEKFKKKGLELQKEELKFGIESIIESCQMIEHSISLSNKNKNDLQLLSMKKLYHSRLDYLSNNIWSIEPCCNPFIEFWKFENEEKSIYSSISNLAILDSTEVSAEKCLILWDEDQLIFKDEEFNYEIISYSKEGNKMKKGGNGKNFGIRIESESKLKDVEYEWKVMDLNDGKYKMRMNLKDEGKYSIFVQYNGMDIPSLPFQIKVSLKLNKRNYHEINQPKLTFGEENPNSRGVAVDLKGNIFVSDFQKSIIEKFDSNGNFIAEFGSDGNGFGEFRGPRGIAVNSKGEILVCDSCNHRIQIFDSEGNCNSIFGTRGIKNGKFNSPSGICVDKNDNIYVCSGHKVQKFDSNGKFILAFGSNGNGNGQFNYPFGIAVNSKGEILVCDSNNHRIQIFDSEGKFISILGSEGKGNGQFSYPGGICVDLDDNILVCDGVNRRIQVFMSNGKYLTQIKFWIHSPINITIDPTTQNIIGSGGDNKISIF